MIITGFFLDQEHRAWGKIRFVFDWNKKVSNFHENVLNFLFHGGMIPCG